MMKPQAQHWCDACDQRIDFDRDKDYVLVDQNLSVLGEPVFLKDQKMAVCPTCKNEIYDEILATEELQASIKQWESKTGLFFADQFPRKKESK